MSDNNKRYRHAEKSMNKKHLALVLAVTALVCLLTVVLTSSLTACNNEQTATPDSMEITTIDEATYVFSDGIYAGSVNLNGLVYKDAKEKLLAECDSLVKDFELKITAADKEYKLKKADFTYANNVNEILLDAVKHSNATTQSNTKKTTDTIFELKVSVSEESVNKKVAEIAKEVDKEAKNATIGSAENNDISFIKDSTGLKLDQPALSKEITKEINKFIKDSKKPADIKAKVSELQPELTYDDINGKIQLLSSFSTYSSNTMDAVHNMTLALAGCNGSVINPGEVWSFNAHAGNGNLTSLGYRPATVIVNGEYDTGIGGGICQASTTVYNAAIRTNMEIVERYCHCFESSYVDAGLDATIAYPYLDLKLKNVTEYPMYFQCYSSGRTMYVSIYGYQDPSFDEVKINNNIYEASYEDNYFKVSTERVFLKDGKEVYREQLPYSEYMYYAEKEEEATTAPPTTAPETKPVEKPTAPVVTTPPVENNPTNPPEPVEPATPAPEPPADPVEPTVAVADNN